MLNFGYSVTLIKLVSYGIETGYIFLLFCLTTFLGHLCTFLHYLNIFKENLYGTAILVCSQPELHICFISNILFQ